MQGLRSSLTAVILAASLAWAGSGTAQARPSVVTTDGWNGPRVMELVERAREARVDLASQGALRTYSAMTEGHIYFFLDPDFGDRALIRVDQVAVEHNWRAPDRVQQHIVGERSETLLPVQGFQYYLDRLTLVQYGLGDEIQVGFGLDVDGVPHPFASAPGAQEPAYDYRLADSLTVVLPGRADPLRLHEIEVRPRDPQSPGAVGSITVEGASAEIVRMSLSFTPASYVDPRTDRISVELDYGLWEDRYWLPNVQRIEVRREVPEIDIGVGTVIRAVLRTGQYRLNAPVPPDISSRPPVTRATSSARTEYPFPEGLYAGVDRDGLTDVLLNADAAEVRAKAVELLEGQASSGLSALRLHVQGFSSVLRFSRTEGLALGAGATIRPDGRIRIRTHAGYAVGSRDPVGDAEFDLALSSSLSLRATGSLSQNRDLGLSPAIDPLLASLGALLWAEDYSDPYRVTGGSFHLTGAAGAFSRLSIGVGIERAESAPLAVTAGPFDPARTARSVRPVSEGTFFRAESIVRWTPEWLPTARPAVEVGALVLSGARGGGAGLDISAELALGPSSERKELLLRARHWSWGGDPLPQGHRLLGGRGTVPGYPFRQFAGRHATLASVEGAVDVWDRFVRLRIAVFAGWAGIPDPSVAQAWGAPETDGILTSASLGMGLGWDILHLDLARGLQGGEWQLLLSVDPDWWRFL